MKKPFGLNQRAFQIYMLIILLIVVVIIVKLILKGFKLFLDILINAFRIGRIFRVQFFTIWPHEPTVNIDRN